MIDKIMTLGVGYQTTMFCRSVLSSSNYCGFALSFNTSTDLYFDTESLTFSHHRQEPIVLELFVDNLEIIIQRLRKLGIQHWEGPYIFSWGLKSINLKTDTGYRLQFSQAHLPR